MDVADYLECRRELAQLSSAEGISMGELETLLTLGNMGLTPTEKHLLEIEEEKISRGSIGNIAENMNHSKGAALSQVSQYLSALGKKGMITKQINPYQQRQRYVELTENGHRIYNDANNL